MGRVTTVALATSACVGMLALGIAGTQHAPALAERLQQVQVGPFRVGSVLPMAVPAAAQPFAAVQSPSWSTTDAFVTQMQDRLKAKPDDAVSYAQLGSLYLQKARETGDPSYYVKADGALAKSLELAPGNVLATVGMGGLHMARHEFEDALGAGQRAVELAPRSYVAYGLIGDALIEIGRYDEAIQAFQTMVDLRPDLTSLSRVSYARELHGDLPGAIVAMREAVDAGAPRSEGTNWSRVQLGNLYFQTGDVENAEQQYRQALNLLPNYAHALGGLARLEAAKGNLKGAIEQYQKILAATPLPQYVAELGDTYLAAGDTAAAAKQAQLMRVIVQLQRGSGMDVDLDMALFEVDHATDAATLEGSLRAARTHYERRPSVHAADVLGWALHRAGRSQEALPYAREALKLGSKDPVVLYHAGAIAAAAGERAEARGYLETALSQNERFHVRFAPEAKKLLEQLRKAV